MVRLGKAVEDGWDDLSSMLHSRSYLGGGICVLYDRLGAVVPDPVSITGAIPGARSGPGGGFTCEPQPDAVRDWTQVSVGAPPLPRYSPNHKAYNFQRRPGFWNAQ